MTPALFACLLILPPVAQGLPERRHELESTLMPSMSECRTYAPQYVAACKANPKHQRDLQLPGVRVVGECKEQSK